MAEETRRDAVLELTRRWDAPPERVWQAWTDPRALSQWFGPGEAGSVTQADLDVRPGGQYTVAFHTPDGEEHRVSGKYEVVLPPRKLAFTWAWQSTPDRVSFVTVELDADGDATLMRFRHERFHDRAALEGHTRGWTTTLEKLDRFLAP
jgi:uncharacterized protein YndB with AHSA1/START domain